MIQGKARWAMIVGAPRPGYNNGPAEWSIDVELSEEAEKKLTAEGVQSPTIKDSRDGTYRFIKFKRKAKNREGQDNTPIRIVDHLGAPWDGKTLIGNGSLINVKYAVNERPKFGGGTAQTASIIAVQVAKLVPYESKGDEFPEYTDDKEIESWS